MRSAVNITLIFCIATAAFAAPLSNGVHLQGAVAPVDPNKDFTVFRTVTVRIKSNHAADNTCLKAWSPNDFNNPNDVNTAVCDPTDKAQKWEIRYLVNGRVAIRSAFNTYLYIYKAGAGANVDLYDTLEDNSTFELLSHNNGWLSLKSFLGNFVKINQGVGKDIDTQTFIGEWEKFRFYLA